jgi:hypothetical protein
MSPVCYERCLCIGYIVEDVHKKVHDMGKPPIQDQEYQHKNDHGGYDQYLNNIPE